MFMNMPAFLTGSAFPDRAAFLRAKNRNETAEKRNAPKDGFRYDEKKRKALRKRRRPGTEVGLRMTKELKNWIFAAGQDPDCLKNGREVTLPHTWNVEEGLEEYRDDKRNPTAYSSYVKTAPQSDRFYDDNVWLGLDFTDLYLLTKEQAYLDNALEIWKFIESGTDTVLGGGIYWCEQRKISKNTCSNAPGAVYALKLYEATGDTAYLQQGTHLYEWTKTTLQDKSDYLYFDNKNLNGHIGRAKFAYNSGQMMQAAALLYKCTGNAAYLTDAQQIAKSAYGFFFHDFKPSHDVEPFRLLNEGNVWFTGIMLRGFVELYGQDGDATYMDAFRANLDYAWEHMRDASTGLFNSDWSGAKQDDSKWLLTQFAMVEMYARMAAVKG